MTGFDPCFGYLAADDEVHVRLSFAPYDESGIPDTEHNPDFLMAIASNGKISRKVELSELAVDENGKILHPRYDLHWSLAEYTYGLPRECMHKKVERQGAGKVGNFCLCKSSKINVLRGLESLEIAITDLKLDDKVWDGVSWVNHEGPIYQGKRKVISYQGLRATADHFVWTECGYHIPLGRAVMERRRLAQTVRGREDGSLGPALEQHDTEMSDSAPSLEQELLRTGDPGAIRFREAVLSLGDKGFPYYGFPQDGVRQNRQRRALHSDQSTVSDAGCEYEELEDLSRGSDSSGGEVPRGQSSHPIHTQVRSKVKKSEGTGLGADTVSLGQLGEQGQDQTSHVGATSSEGASTEDDRRSGTGVDSKAYSQATVTGAERQRDSREILEGSEVQAGKSICPDSGVPKIPSDVSGFGVVRLSEYEAWKGCDVVTRKSTEDLQAEKAFWREVEHLLPGDEVDVYDIVNAGPRNRFTANGVLVSNSSMYGATALSLERKIEADTGVKPAEGTGQKILDALTKRQPKATAWLEEMQELPAKIGLYTAASGKKRHFHTHSSGSGVGFRMRNSIESAQGRQARNFPYCIGESKQGELLGSPEAGNQQPSLGSNSFEGSTTRSRYLVEVCNGSTSALPFFN